MSHSKFRKKGKSLYIDSWNPSAKKYVNTCKICGKCGYSPVIEAKEFSERLPNQAIYSELTKIYNRLELDEYGRCKQCAEIMDKK